MYQVLQLESLTTLTILIGFGGIYTSLMDAAVMSPPFATIFFMSVDASNFSDIASLEDAARLAIFCSCLSTCAQLHLNKQTPTCPHASSSCEDKGHPEQHGLHYELASSSNRHLNICQEAIRTHADESARYTYILRKSCILSLPTLLKP